jgi:hypothetical protein
MEKPAQYVTELIALAKKHGLKKLKCGDIEFEFNESAPIWPKDTKLADLASETEPTPTEDEFLFWSTGYTPDQRVKEGN